MPPEYVFQLVKNAMTWPFIQDGIPILYYGQEQGYTGGADPANREACVSQVMYGRDCLN